MRWPEHRFLVVDGRGSVVGQKRQPLNRYDAGRLAAGAHESIGARVVELVPADSMDDLRVFFSRWGA